MTRLTGIIAAVTAMVAVLTPAAAAKAPPGFFGVVPQAQPTKSDFATVDEEVGARQVCEAAAKLYRFQEGK